MSDLTLFRLDDGSVRVEVDDNGDPWFVLADLCDLLGITNRGNVAARLADDQKGVRLADTPGGRQSLTFVNESGMWTVILRSDSPAAEPVRRWVTGTVLPSIRQTGGYSAAPALSEDEIVHQALTITNRRVEALTARVAELEPRAAVADHLLDATGDMSVGDAAKTLARSGAAIGQQRLFEFLDAIGWTYRKAGVRHIKQSAIEAGVLTALPKSHHHPRTGELVIDPPQVRVTAKGIARLLPRLLPTEEAA